MTHKRLFNISSVIATAAFISGLLAGCMEKDLYDPNYGKDPVPDPGEYFGFETRGDVKLSVNYDLPGLIALLEVYDEDPMETVDNESVKKEGIEALFKIYTDKNGKYEGKMNIPTSVESIYLYTSSWGVPRCVKLDLKDGLASLDMSKITSPSANTKAVTRSYNFSKGSVPYTINSSANLYSLCKWGNCGLLSYIVDQSHQYIDDNPNPGYITHIGKVGAEDIGVFTKRMMQFFGNSADNSELVRESGVSNRLLKGKWVPYTITRTFDKASFNKENLKVYNPYIIVGYAANQKNRTEVHLPKHEATAYADASLIGSGNDAYYIDSEGAYPFAIDIPMSDFVPVTETHNIDTEYPYFKDWADSGGAKHTNWYKEYRSPQK